MSTTKEMRERFEKQFVHGPFSGVMPQHRDGGVTLKNDLLEFITSELSLLESSLRKEYFEKGFRKGFDFSGEGFNGEYHNSRVNLEEELKKEIAAQLLAEVRE